MSIARRKFCYLVVLNEKFLTQLASDLFLQIEQVLRLIGIKDINFTNSTLFVFRGKGKKDRYTLLPKSLHSQLTAQIEYATMVHQQDIKAGFGFTSLPVSLIKKYKNAAKDLSWQYLFPSTTRCQHPMMAIFAGITYTKPLLENS
ncbi:hypothetical protein [Pseudoalteromonas piscicida]|uniref:hypothetical protein n=1 Tax=Pseudoalteromonas piscicida TaxID=43662 RepID=UPI001CB6DC4F|nr:hypothetical protein [Pseudoalteromonas piscicida]